MATRAVVLFTLAALTAVCEGCGARSNGSPAEPGSPDFNDLPFPVHLTAQQSKGRKIFEEACASCHGRAGRGDTATTPTVDGRLPDLSDKRYATLTPTELAARFAAAHGESLRSVVTAESTRAALSYLPVLAYPVDAAGSAVRGRELYGRYCSSCHGIHGDGNGPAAVLLDTRPTDFTRDPLVMARDFDALVRDIRDGPGLPHISSMPSWGPVLNPEALADVAAYLPAFTETRPRHR
ncbi:MAG: c-type cytochrome [Gemmatimonadetes bacterium]|nr:c-type cytochrome [Gemmatimonadota bacterium]